MRYVDEFLYNLVAELKLWSARHRARRAAASRVGPLTGLFAALTGSSRAGAELERPLS